MADTADVFGQIVDFPTDKHLRVLGLPGSGKTRALIQRYRKLVASGLDGRVFIVTYSRDQLQQLTGALLADGEAAAGPTPVVTYYALARELLATLGQRPPQLIEGLEENLIVRRILREHGARLKSDFRSIYDSERFQRELIAVFHTLLQNRVRGERLEKVSSACRDRRLTDVLSLFERYLRELDTRGAVTYFDVAWAAADRVGSVDAAGAYADADVLLVDDFQDVDAGQFAMLEALAEQRDVVLNVFGDPMGAYFAFRGTDARFLRTDFEHRFDCETISMPAASVAPATLGRSLAAVSHEVLGKGSRQVIGDNWLQPPRSQGGEWGPLFHDTRGGAVASDDRVSLTCVKDEIAECYAAAAYVHDKIESGDCAPYDIAVVANEKQLYEPLLRAAFAQRGLLLDTGRLVQSEFRGFVHALLTLLESPDDVVFRQAFMTSAFYPYFSEIALDYEPTTSDKSAEQKAVGDFVKATADYLRAREPDVWATHIVKTCLMPASRGYEKQSQDDTIYGFSSLLMDRWVEFVAVAQAMGEPVSFKTFLRESGLFGVQSTAPMPTADEVGFYSAREMKGRAFPYVVVLGCSELMLPAPLKRDLLMPVTALQKTLDEAVPDLSMSVYHARSADDHLAEQFHLLYHVLTRATAELKMYAPASFAGQSRPAPSAILRQHLPSDRVEHIEPSENDLPPSFRFARRWVVADTDIETPSALTSLSEIGALWHTAALPPARFAIDRFSLSKSSVENYCRCPRQFYYRKVLRVDEEDSGALMVGKIYHDAMAGLAEPGQQKHELHAAASDDRIHEVIDEAMRRVGVRASTFFARALRFHVYAMVKRTLDADRRDDERDYTVAAVETQFKYDFDGFEFNGRADRVEQTTMGLEVVDFKTGKNFPKMGKTVRRNVMNDLERPADGDWQVPIYAWGYKDNENDWPNAFRHVVQRPGEDPFAVTMFVRDDALTLPPSAESNKRVHNPYSYLLAEEIEAIMKAAAATAEQIFGDREYFDKTDRLDFCRSCSFNTLCDRRVD